VYATTLRLLRSGSGGDGLCSRKRYVVTFPLPNDIKLSGERSESAAARC